MQYSPKLKRVMAQIEKLLKDNDVAGIVVIHTPGLTTGSPTETAGYSEYLNFLTPSYSCLEYMPKHEGVTIKGKLEHYGGDKAKRDKKLSATVNMLHHLTMLTGQEANKVMQISEAANKAFDAEHGGGGGHSSHTEQNN